MRPHEIDVVLAAVRAEIAPLEARVNAAELRLATAEAGLAAAAAAASKSLPAVTQRSGGMTVEVAEKIAETMIEGVRGYFRRSVAGLVDRVRALESRPVLHDAGVFDPLKAYDAGAAVTYDGSLWIAQRCTLLNEKPGDGNGAFRLAVKRGRDGRDAPR